MEIFLHIGPPKTGSTSIQYGLHLNRAALNEQGVYLPYAGRTARRYAAQQNLCWELRQNDLFRRRCGTWADLQVELNRLNRFQKVILSSEHFSSLKSDQVLFIKDQLANHRVWVVLYLRRQDKLLQSTWMEMIKNPISEFTTDFPSFLRDYTEFHRRMDYNHIISNWSAVFGEDRLILRHMEKISADQHLLHDFLEACQVSNYQDFSLPDVLNPSLGPKTIKALRDFKLLLNRKEDAPLRKFIFLCLMDYAQNSAWNDIHLNLVDENLFNEIASRYESTNCAIAQKFFGTHDLFREPFKPQTLTPLADFDLNEEDWLNLMTSTPLSLLVKPHQREQILNMPNAHSRVHDFCEICRKTPVLMIDALYLLSKAKERLTKINNP